MKCSSDLKKIETNASIFQIILLTIKMLKQYTAVQILSEKHNGYVPFVFIQSDIVNTIKSLYSTNKIYIDNSSKDTCVVDRDTLNNIQGSLAGLYDDNGLCFYGVCDTVNEFNDKYEEILK